ncbi:MAG: type II toxin-antitoxin system VapC family toxin [Alphaproteobacteria bacterium]|nr:type II toxin-antitoxin system VapC family toxin [Alphaproteobacteria bacterium]
MLYLDTSVLVCALTNEADTEKVQAWLAGQVARELQISDWVVTEFSSALSIKLRTGQMGAEHRAASLAVFTRLAAETLDVLPVERASFRRAAGFADQPALNLRAGDALHLALCADTGAKLCTLDRRLSEAAPQVGVETVLL